MTRIAVIVGSTRPTRQGDQVGRWTAEVTRRHPAVVAGTATVELVDLTDFALPLLDEPVPALFRSYRHAHTVRWAETVDAFDGFVFVTPEYNHSAPPALTNAIAYLYAEWNDKAAGFVSYGVDGGTRAVEHLRQILGEVKVADVRTQVTLSLFTDFEITDPAEPGVFTPGERHESSLATLLDEVIAWAEALAPLRRVPAGAAL
jgi:NAD(P)H-dependent FMN reductase